MIPISDDSPRRFTPYVNYILLITNIVVFYFEPSSSEPHRLGSFFQSYGLVPQNIITANNPTSYVTLFSSMFLHADILHLLGNMLYLWIFGDNIEFALGHARYFVFYLVVGLGAAAGQIILDPQSTIPMIGASGAISGVLGAYLVRFPRNRVSILFFFIIFIRVIKVPAILALGLWFAYQLYSGYSAHIAGQEAGVAWFAHIGGFLCGVVLVKLFEWYPRYN